MSASHSFSSPLESDGCIHIDIHGKLNLFQSSQLPTQFILDLFSELDQNFCCTGSGPISAVTLDDQWIVVVRQFSWPLSLIKMILEEGILMPRIDTVRCFTRCHWHNSSQFAKMLIRSTKTNSSLLLQICRTQEIQEIYKTKVVSCEHLQLSKVTEPESARIRHTMTILQVNVAVISISPPSEKAFPLLTTRLPSRKTSSKAILPSI
jgi:hypothetical protein